jgi:hypothetical protein
LNLSYQGETYNLNVIYNKLNTEYFNNTLDLQITWFGDSSKRNKSNISFGLYHEALRLIKINRIMDSPLFPEYVINFIIYHEMLHHACPPFVDENGIHRIHHRDFKNRERQFKDFDIAKKWIKQNSESLFMSQVA